MKNINWDAHLELPKYMEEFENEEELEMDLQIGDRVRVLHVEEMLIRGGEKIQDRFGEFIQFYDEDEEPVLDAIFPLDEEDYQNLEGKIFTINDISRYGDIDLLEDNNVGYAVTKEMVEKIGGSK